MFPRERGSQTPQHQPSDLRCVKHTASDDVSEDASCEVCSATVAREQAAAAFNHRELGS